MTNLRKAKRVLWRTLVFSVLLILILCLIGLINLTMMPFQLCVAALIFFVWNGLAGFIGHLFPEISPAIAYVLGSLITIAGGLYKVIKPRLMKGKKNV